MHSSGGFNHRSSQVKIENVTDLSWFNVHAGKHANPNGCQWGLPLYRFDECTYVFGKRDTGEGKAQKVMII
jgi:hypothetical protein